MAGSLDPACRGEVLRAPQGPVDLLGLRTGNNTERAYLRRLVVLYNTAHRPLRRTKRAVQHVHVDLARLILATQPTPDLESATLCRASSAPVRYQIGQH
jgi:hypothetical protein